MAGRAAHGSSLLLLLASLGAWGEPFSPSARLDFSVPPPVLAAHCASAIQRADSRLSALASLPKARGGPDGAPEALDRILWDLSDDTASDAFLMHVSVSSVTRQAGQDCQTALEKFSVDVYTRPELYAILKTSAKRSKSLSPEVRRLVEKELLDFRRNGLELPPEKRAEVKKIRQRIVELEQTFERNIGEVKSTLPVTRAELDGLPDDYIARLPREGDKYLVGLDYPDYYPFMDNAKDGDARRRLETLFDNRAAPENLAVLREVLELRRRAARLLGYKDHAAFVEEDRMAKSPARVRRFLNKLRARLEPLGRAERAKLLELKRAEQGPTADAVLHAWEWRYYHNQGIKANFQVDQEKIKEYFPLETVTQGMLSVYERLLGVRFRRIPDPAAWHKDVFLYEVTDAAGGPPLGWFYMDLFPREGKYKHAAAFDLVKGRLMPDGRYQPPVSAIVANFNKPAPGRPSLLKHGEHGEVETYFHEFGHIMHQTLTRASLGRFSGTNVARDFVEAPSQMLENWVWDPEVLTSLSGHYQDPSRKLPKELLTRMIAARDADLALVQLRQIFFGLVDLRYHTDAKVADTTAVYQELMGPVSLIPMSEGTHPEASFGHLMGYDAGYYGYLWSKVFAQDMFSLFEKAGLLDAGVGRRYRREILEPGSTRDESDSLRAFLGRKPGEDAFLRRMGLAAKKGD